MAKLSLRPTKKTEEDELRAFVSQANNDSTVKESNEPWNDARVRPDMMVMVSLRLPEPYAIKLRYLSEKSHISQQELLRSIVLPWIDAEISKY